MSASSSWSAGTSWELVIMNTLVPSAEAFTKFED
jgi:hypothetical protein